MEILIGTKFIKKNKKTKNICIVVDILKTYNSKNELIKTEYIASTEFFGQKLLNIYPKSTIILNLIK